MNVNSHKLNSDEIPQRLKQIPQPPKQLFYRGNLPAEGQIFASIVGTRRPTQYGVDITKKLAFSLAQRGVIVVSGLALGVDSIAHRAALDANGTTVAVLPSSIDNIYPKSHRNLSEAIVESGGCLLSEYSDNDIFKGNFIERNRLVAGLGDILIITEAALKSGTTSTANFALDQGKTVAVVPGNITSVMSAGTNNLIKEGAIPITSPEDVFELLNLDSKSNTYQPKNPAEQAIIECYRQGIRDVDSIAATTSLDVATINIAMTQLQIAKVI